MVSWQHLSAAGPLPQWQGQTLLAARPHLPLLFELLSEDSLTFVVVLLVSWCTLSRFNAKNGGQST